ncbi:MAG: hypothetical protein EA405_09165 [Rhodospirillales bacterium]|nr:MAG: hypothetical protein EA405_09165 [Rhodospirillales bacterium]
MAVGWRRRSMAGVTWDAGALLLRETDRAISLIDRVAACCRDGRDPGRVVHTLRTLIGQRIIRLALGYEDVNDHDDLRFDPVLALFTDRLEPRRYPEKGLSEIPCAGGRLNIRPSPG